MNKLTVIWNGHGPVAMEQMSHRYITDKPVEVPETSYYLRRLADGELKLVTAEDTPPQKELE